MLSENEFDQLMERIFAIKRKPEHTDVVLCFKRNVKMHAMGLTYSWFYFGECTTTTNLPHGRGILFGINAIRVGYFTNGVLSDGKVFKLATG